ncbi:hypothetical protein J4E93_002787 [Alternaria ventricosa]|uniref:uncharacterized protein n=1 Tax=Alternaria ventricosa TaxID=1187951 RepID=UPI0020C4E975|nr:uncharacterized protein J4E93_002787 [Alternaria ventricosa]KAI4650431.1 hypothetical protein J4E93_002787 [Alternaria ventricosa]
MPQGRSRLLSDNELVFSDVLAPYAVHVSNLYEALTRIVGAARQKIAYVNPSNGVEFHGWMVPDPDKTANGVLKITSRKYHLSDQSIERLRDFMKNVPGLKLMSNPIAPLVCDLYLYDEQEDVSYNVEHKAYGEENPHIPLKPLDSDFDLKLNWHFLLVQKGESLAIHTRSGGDSADTTARLISMVEDGSCTDFASIIRENGPHAKARLREKWKEADLYDDTVDFGPIAKGENSEGGTPGSHHSAIEVALMGLAFRVHINEQCYKLRKHACILLHNHPAADAVMVEHEWTTTDQELYEASGLLPVSLVAGAAGAKRCILLKFIPHHRPEAVKSTSELFELAANTGWTFPVCTAQDFVFVAMTGGFAMPDQVPCLDNIALLPSSLTTILPQSRACVTCEDKSRVREWNWVRTTIGGCELSRSSRGKLFSFPASPYIKSEAKPLNKLYTLNDGSVHEFFHKVFNANDTELTTSIHGSSGLLQRQWNHGDMKLHDDNKAHTAFRLIQRVLVGMSLSRTQQNQPFVTNYNQDFSKVFLRLKEEKNWSNHIIKSSTMAEMVKVKDRGIKLQELIENSGLATGTVKVSCDECLGEDTCTFLHPEIVYTLPDADYCCGKCYERRLHCKFTKLPEDFLQSLRTLPLLRAHVPCHACWESGKLCDNNSGSCKNCESSSLTCERVACEAYNESRDNWFCPRHCDKAHYNDGYSNVVEHPRPRRGYNAQIAARKAVIETDTRVSVCTECWRTRGDKLCTNAKICPPCTIRIQKGDAIACTRIRCAAYTECSVDNCKFAHPAQPFEAGSLVDFEPFPRRR